MVARARNFHGVAAIEFALVFPLVFVMLYGLLTYSLIFAMQHSLSLAAAEAGRSTVRFIKNNDSVDDRKAAACIEINNTLSWLEALVGNISCDKDGGGATGLDIGIASVACVDDAQSLNVQCINIRIKYEYEDHPLVPTIFLLPVPKAISAESFSRISLSY